MRKSRLLISHRRWSSKLDRSLIRRSRTTPMGNFWSILASVFLQWFNIGRFFDLFTNKVCLLLFSAPQTQNTYIFWHRKPIPICAVCVCVSTNDLLLVVDCLLSIDEPVLNYVESRCWSQQYKPGLSEFRKLTPNDELTDRQIPSLGIFAFLVAASS